MSFQPVLPFAGVSGWAFLNRTRDSQQSTFNSSSVVERDTDYFRSNISQATTAKDLVSDRRLLSVALGAFGLDDDIGNRHFIQKILEGGTLEPDSLANRLSDKRYLAISKAFGYGDFSVSNTQLSDFPGKIIDSFQNRQFEISIGNQNDDMRLALSVDRDLANVLKTDTTKDGFWFSVMGTPTLRKVFSTALGLPASLVSVDLDRQLDVFREKAEKTFGESEVTQFSDPDKRERLIRLFLVRGDTSIASAGYSPGQVAVSLLQNAGIKSTV